MKSSRLYYLNNDSDEPDMRISLTSNLVTLWVAAFLPITSHQKAAMLIAEGWTLCMPVLVALGFTVDTLYYGGKKL